MAGMNRTLSGCCALFLSVAALAPASAADFVRIEGGTFEMGSEEFYREEGPVRQVTVRPFLISSTEVTNADFRSEEHTSELQSLMRTSYAVFCLKKKKHRIDNT